MSANRRCVVFISAEAFDFFSQGEDWKSCSGVSWCDLSDCELEARTDVPAVLVVCVSFFCGH